MPLVNVQELLTELDDPSLVVADVRYGQGGANHGRHNYTAAHIPGAVHVDLDRDLADPASGTLGGRHPLPSLHRFGDFLGSIGVTPITRVIAYDDMGGAIAARLWWMLRAVGHTDVAVLDGGWDAWLAAGGPVVEGERPIQPTSPYPVVGFWPGTVDINTTAREAKGEGRVVVDSRSPERFAGDHEPIDKKAGHIPGAINLFHGDVLDSDGFHRSPEELREHFDGVGSDPILYCGSGVTACHNLLALEIAGITGADLFPGSWSQWSADPTRPVAVE